VPDATGLELLAGELRDAGDGVVTNTLFFRGRGTIEIDPARVREALAHLAGRGFTFLASVHGLDYYPEEPRLGVVYELLDMEKPDRLTVKLRVSIEHPEVPSVVELHPGADHQEREVYDMFGVIFTGHPDLRRILMPEDYEGHPQRRDFPVGGEPVIFTQTEDLVPGWIEGGGADA
jgi:NADH-quinone oxidoreductase subunit C